MTHVRGINVCNSSAPRIEAETTTRFATISRLPIKILLWTFQNCCGRARALPVTSRWPQHAGRCPWVKPLCNLLRFRLWSSELYGILQNHMKLGVARLIYRRRQFLTLFDRPKTTGETLFPVLLLESVVNFSGRDVFSKEGFDHNALFHAPRYLLFANHSSNSQTGLSRF